MSGTFELGEATIEATAAVGAVVVPWAGDRADLLQRDAVGAAGLRVTPLAAGAEVLLPFGGEAAVRVDGGADWGLRTADFGLELAHAALGWVDPGGIAAFRAGRLHIGITSDRAFEQEDLALAFRPIASRTLLPLHANGVEASVSWPGRLTLSSGGFWAAPTSETPHVWARLDLTPLGPLPEREDGDAEEPVFALGGGVVLLDSPLLGAEQTFTADGSVTWNGMGLDAGWVRQVTGKAVTDNEWVAARSRIVRFPGDTDLFVAGRYEWVSDLLEGEDSRSIALARVSWRSPGAFAAVYLEASTSREGGPGLVGTGDVIDLERAERPNDWFGAGAWARW